MSEKLPIHKPETLYRGITLPADAIDEAIFTGDLNPGSAPQLNAQGHEVVADGNEYGVYMSDNAHMSEVAYATPRRGDALPDSPAFNWKGSSQSRVETPRVGVLYEIDTKEIDVRKPLIVSHLQGHYNNGFEGEEWITDSVPAASHRVAKLKIGPDMLHPAQEFNLSEGHEKALEALREEVAYRAGRLVTASAIINAVPDKRRHFPGVAERALTKMPPK